MQLAQLLRRGLRRGAHQQVHRLLVHREHRHLAQVLRADQQHDDAVDAGRHAAMRRRAVLEGPVEAAETLLDRLARQAAHLERLDHGLGQMVADAARGDLEAVADHVVLERLDVQRILAVQRIDPALRHRERVVREVDRLGFLVPFVEREIDDPAQLEAVAVDQVELLAGPRAGSARQS